MLGNVPRCHTPNPLSICNDTDDGASGSGHGDDKQLSQVAAKDFL